MDSNRIEYKREYTNTIVKEVIAFANSKGGTIFVGLDDSGKLVGLSDAKKDLDRISSLINDSIEPSLSLNCSLEIKKIDKKDIIEINVSSGVMKPYYVKSKGLTPNGVYVRLGATSVPATRDLIIQMLKESSNFSDELSISSEQELTFTYAKHLFKEKNVSFGESEFKTLGMVREDKYTNLGLLLSDQNPFTIKIAVYETESRVHFLNRHEVKGSILYQIEEACQYISTFNTTSSTILGLERIDKSLYPYEAIREAVLNAVCHRRYDLNTSIMINIFPSHMDIVSYGGLVNDLTVDDIKTGASFSRNPKLQSLLHRLNLLEAYGSGIPRMFELYEGYSLKPTIKLSDNVFSLSLPKQVEKSDSDRVLSYINLKQETSTSEICEKLRISKSKVIRIINALLEDDTILKEGEGKNTVYKIK